MALVFHHPKYFLNTWLSYRRIAGDAPSGKRASKEPKQKHLKRIIDMIFFIFIREASHSHLTFMEAS